MITVSDLDSAIAECLGQKSPGANTCIKLAAYYIIKNELETDKTQNEHSFSANVQAVDITVPQLGESEFLKAVSGKKIEDVILACDELMQTLYVVNPPLYKAALRLL